MSVRQVIAGRLRKMADFLAPFSGMNMATTFAEATLQAFPMLPHIQRWEKLYQGNMDWLNPTKGLYTMNIPAVISSHIARITTLNLRASITAQAEANDGDGDDAQPTENSVACAGFLDKSFQRFVGNLRKIVEYAAALGSIALKPVPVQEGDGWRIDVDYILAGRFIPVSFDSTGNVTACIFTDYATHENRRYMRVEYHEWIGTKYTIRNEIYDQGAVSEGTLIGSPVPLQSVPRWAHLQAKTEFRNVEEPLFAILNMPLANTIDPFSPLGISIFAHAEGMIEQADKMYSQLIWEMTSGARALYVHYNAFQGEETQPGLEFQKDSLEFQRFYRLVETPTDGDGYFHEWSPKLREDSYTNALNTLLRGIEDACALSRGILSAPTHATQLGAKTATELKMQQHTTASTIGNVRDNLRPAMKRVANAMYAWTQLVDENGVSVYNMCPDGLWDINAEFDDSLITDESLQFIESMQQLDRGLMVGEKHLQWYYGLSETEAKQWYEKGQEQLKQRQEDIAKIKAAQTPPGRGELEPSNLANNPDDDGRGQNSVAN